MAGFDKVKRKLGDINGKVLFLDHDWVGCYPFCLEGGSKCLKIYLG